MYPTKLMLMTAVLTATSFFAIASETGRISADQFVLVKAPAAIQLSQTQPAPVGTMQPGMPMPGAPAGQGVMPQGQPGAAQPGMGGMMGMMGRGQGAMPQAQPGTAQPGMGGMMEMMEMMGMGQRGMSQGQSGVVQPGMPMGGPMQGRSMMGMGPGTGYAAPVNRVEGRIAFLRAELSISDAQSAAWNAYADALRAGARRHNEMREHMMAAPATPANASGMMELHERMLSARLESTKAVRAALERLQAVLTEQQRGTLNELMPMQFGML